MDIRNLKGSIVALVTPFHPDGSVNFEKLRELTEWHIENGTDAILALGTTGESSTMTHEEDDAVLQTVIAAAAGRVPVIAGTGSNATQTMLEKSLRAQELGADGLLLITPYYNKGNGEGICRHFTAVAETSPASSTTSPAAPAAPSPWRTWSGSPDTPTSAGIKEAQRGHVLRYEDCHCILPDSPSGAATTNITIPLLVHRGQRRDLLWATFCPAKCHDMVMDYPGGPAGPALAAAKRIWR